MASPRDTPPTADKASFTVEEYRIYEAVMGAPMSVPEEQAHEKAARRYGVSEARKTTDKVQEALFANGWFGTPASEIRHASDWKGQTP